MAPPSTATLIGYYVSGRTRRFVHLVRDGRDVGQSTIPMGWAGNLYSGIRIWVEAEELWAKLEERLPDDRHMTLSYEGLVSDPVGELTRICHFVGIEYDPAMLSYDKSSTYSKPSTSGIAKWKSLPATHDRGGREPGLLSGLRRTATSFRVQCSRLARSRSIFTRSAIAGAACASPSGG